MENKKESLVSVVCMSVGDIDCRQTIEVECLHHISATDLSYKRLFSRYFADYLKPYSNILCCSMLCKNRMFMVLLHFCFVENTSDCRSNHSCCTAAPVSEIEFSTLQNLILLHDIYKVSLTREKNQKLHYSILRVCETLDFTEAFIIFLFFSRNRVPY